MLHRISEAAELAFAFNQSPIGVVAVLFANFRITPFSTNMALRVRANPDRGVGRRNRQLLDPRDMRGITYRLAVGLAVDEIFARL